MNEAETIETAINNNIKYLQTAYEKAQAYANLVIFAGYGGFFGLWQITKDYLGPKQAIGAALLMLFSISFFVFFEVYKVHVRGRQLGRFQKLLSDPEIKKSADSYNSAVNQFRDQEMKTEAGWQKTWQLFFYPTVIFGLLAILILAIAFVSRLLSCN